MNELVQIVVEKTGLSQEKAQLAVGTVVTYLKGKLPESVAGQLDAILGGAGSTGTFTEKAKSVVAGLSGLMGKKSD